MVNGDGKMEYDLYVFVNVILNMEIRACNYRVQHPFTGAKSSRILRLIFMCLWINDLDNDLSDDLSHDPNGDNTYLAGFRNTLGHKWTSYILFEPCVNIFPLTGTWRHIG